MSERKSISLSVNGGDLLKGFEWAADQNAKGNVVIFEGMEEHVSRYDAFAKFLNKNGILKDMSKHYDVLKDMNNYINSINYKIHKITPSPIKGKSGNIEYLAYIKRESNSNIDLYNTVKKAFGVD